ncbi:MULTISPECIES: nitrite reductase small subunit NirD [Aneurinibacillus]|jgi:nitrite reductase (NADH) small subunit|uniref:Assimilatory nitrite reductase [NAD(P)H] small subunit n=1 Tax=Aneurinibacillus danicus TaxID=267746 RepID=A0A511VAG7_9BACL|nr:MULTISPECIES: nitrite reductase small subunit NirD [Aneurinibacillus]GEN34898.1 assimilatory nitrite reductase [NAD(P)H] small subunit [Aneurinibacillus danicus]
MKRYRIGPIESLPVQTGRVVYIENREIAVFRLSNGEVQAVENRCPHKGGPLAEGIVSGNYVFCPLHDRKINLKDGLVQKPDIGCVRTYPVELIEGTVILGIPVKEAAISG